MLVLPSYVNQSIDLLYFANQLTGFDMRATLAFNGLRVKKLTILFKSSNPHLYPTKLWCLNLLVEKNVDPCYYY